MANPVVRCAVYTRKSSDEGLEQSFNSLHAQREACEAYILSQKHEGWHLVPAEYDDGGFSGGSMDRPGLKALLTDVEAGLVDTIVVYKVDRLTRSLADFAKMVELFDARGASFVSITQAFNTTTSMGRLTLNVLLSFAQFEREVTGERIRDKIAASKAKGMWMGGAVPLGFDVVDRQLLVNTTEADQVRQLFALYRKHRAVDDVVARAAKLGIVSKVRANAAGQTSGGGKITRGALYRILANPLYVGEIGHKDKRYAGQHQAIVDRKLYDAVQKILDGNRRKARGAADSRNTALLAGLMFDTNGNRLISTHTNKAGKRYRYYAGGDLRIPAGDLETLVTSEVATRLNDPSALVGLLPDVSLLTGKMLAKARALAGALAPEDDRFAIRAAFGRLVSRIVIGEAGITVSIELSAFDGPDQTTTLTIPTSLGKVNAKLMLILPGKIITKPDAALVSIIAQAREWIGLLTSGQQRTIDGIAQAVNVTPAYVRQHIGAGFLAPDLVTTIVEGRQPVSLSVASLRGMLPLPADWGQQRALFAALN